jgi:ADP-ribosylglycohydrolase
VNETDAVDHNRALLEDMFRTGAIDVRRGPLFDHVPSQMPSDLPFSRIEGMLLGLAVGDALGNTSESQLPTERMARYGEIRDHLPNNRLSGRRSGLPSDDTQLAFWTLEQMLADGAFVPQNVARRFCQERIFGIGGSVRAFLSNMKAGVQWDRAGPKSAGNGALMRIAPMLLPHLRTGSTALWTDTALSAMITHNDSASIAACLAFVGMLWRLMQMTRAPEPEWWLHTYVESARGLEQNETYRSNAPAFAEYCGTLWRFVRDAVTRAHDLHWSTLEACNTWYSGAYLFETMPCVIYILMRHGHDPEEAIIRAVNDTWDNDTIAAIVGAAVGALHGRRGLPERWVKGLLGRTAEADDGQVFPLLERARRAWWH